MKKIQSITRFITTFSFALLLILIAASCSKKDDSSAIVIPGVVDGNWRVNLYIDNSADETTNFTGYTFTFSPGGQVMATNGANTVSGTWSESSTRFIIDFGVIPGFDKLSHDWLKEERTTTSIKVKDDNPARIDKLQFIRL